MRYQSFDADRVGGIATLLSLPSEYGEDSNQQQESSSPSSPYDAILPSPWDSNLGVPVDTDMLNGADDISYDMKFLPLAATGSDGGEQQLPTIVNGVSLQIGRQDLQICEDEVMLDMIPTENFSKHTNGTEQLLVDARRHVNNKQLMLSGASEWQEWNRRTLSAAQPPTSEPPPPTSVVAATLQSPTTMPPPPPSSHTTVNTHPPPQHSPAIASPSLANGQTCFTSSIVPARNIQVLKRPYEDPLLCKLCGHRSKYPCDMKKHLQVHSDEKKFECPQCQRTFRRLHQLTVHQRIHTGVKPYACNQCGAEFRHDSSLSMHVRTRHHHAKPFQCELCSKKFGRASHLAKHQRVHLTCGRQPTTPICKYCEATFLSSAELKSHRKLCSSNPRAQFFSCEFCPEEFYISRDYEDHLLSHFNKKSTCQHCGKTFNDGSLLREHVRKIHPQLSSKEEVDAALQCLLHDGGLSDEPDGSSGVILNIALDADDQLLDILDFPEVVSALEQSSEQRSSYMETMSSSSAATIVVDIPVGELRELSSGFYGDASDLLCGDDDSIPLDYCVEEIETLLGT